MAPAYRRLSSATPYEKATNTLRSLPRLAHVAAGVVTFLATAGLYAYSCKDGHCAAARWYDRGLVGQAASAADYTAADLSALQWSLSSAESAKRPQWTAIRDTWDKGGCAIGMDERLC